MTQAEFARGWKLLILQPWGWRYRAVMEDPRTRQIVPSEESRMQLEFYFSKLSWAQVEAWMKVADLFAQGKEWPSVAELQQALRQVNRDYVQALPKPSATSEPMPDEVREILSRISGTMTMETHGRRES
jgi:hypothetical protein